MKILTYSLQNGTASSDEFYRDAARLTDAVLLHGEQALLPAAQGLHRYVELTGGEELRTVEEYAFDLLTLGVLWRTYSGTAGRLPAWRARVLRGMVRLRTESPRLKPAADRIRGSLGSRWLLPSPQAEQAAAAEPASSPLTRKDGLDPLILWLEASGEFNQEAARLRLWQRYLSRQPAGTVRETLRTALSEAEWFEAASLEALGAYTSGVEDYRRLQGALPRSREDAVLRNRRQVEYHLNLLGAELMNRVYRKDYAAASGHAVLLPACLRARTGRNCAAVGSGKPQGCLQCTKECRVAQAVEMGREEGFQVIVVSHESDAFSHSLIERLVSDNAAIVGVACALNLVSGGLRAKAAGIPAQCVILDYCGCGAHWDDNGGFATDLNLERLRQIATGGKNGIKQVSSAKINRQEE